MTIGLDIFNLYRYMVFEYARYVVEMLFIYGPIATGRAQSDYSNVLFIAYTRFVSECIYVYLLYRDSILRPANAVMFRSRVWSRGVIYGGVPVPRTPTFETKVNASGLIKTTKSSKIGLQQNFFKSPISMLEFSSTLNVLVVFLMVNCKAPLAHWNQPSQPA